MDKRNLKEILSPLSYHVTQENGTERPFENEFDRHFEKGLYVDIVSGEPLFASTAKFDSGCGWPAFSMPVEAGSVTYMEDHSHGMNRIEVRSAQAGSHLGHVFPDGPAKTGGLRYCINSAALRFIPFGELDQEQLTKFEQMTKG